MAFSMRLTGGIAGLLLGVGGAVAGVSAQVLELGRPVLQIGTADGDSTEILFGVFAAARLSDGSVVIMNNGTSELRVFDARGSFKQKIGGRGRGPGEFTGLQSMDVIRGDTIVTYDVFLGRITWFTANGKVARTMLMSPLGNGVLPRAVGFLNDGRMVARTDFNRVFGVGPTRDTVTFVLYNAQGAPADTLGRYPGEEEFFVRGDNFSMRRPVIFGRGVFASAEGSAIAIGSNDAYRYDLFDARGRRIQTVQEPATPTRVRKADVDAVNKAWIEGMRQEQRERMQSRLKDFPASETFAAYEDLIVGRDGSVWTGSPNVPGTERIWTARPPNGAAKRQVRAPAGFQPLEAGPDYILGRLRDALGVEYVNVYRLGWK